MPVRPSSGRPGRLSVEGARAPSLVARAPAGDHRAHRRGGDRVLRDPLPGLARVALDRGVLSLRLGAATALGRGRLRGAPLGAAADPVADLRLDRRRLLRGRPDPLAQRGRPGRRRARDRAREHPGRPRRTPCVGAPPRAAEQRVARGDPGRRHRDRPHLGRARGGRLRREPAARSRARCADGGRVLGLPARLAPGRPRCDRPGWTASTRRSRRRSAAW